MNDTRKSQLPAILLVDDDPVFRRLMAVMFTQDGFSVSTANDSESALKMIDQIPFQIAVVDYKLPDLSGIDFFERTRRTHPSIMRILLTAHSTEEVLLESINRGEVYRYLTKPVHMGLLRSTVDQALALHDLQTTKGTLVAELERRNRELEDKNLDLSNYYHLMGELKAQQDQILASLPEPFLLLRADRRVLRCNQAAIDMLGYSRGEMLGKLADEFFSETTELSERVEDVGRSGLTYFETDLKRRAGDPVKVKVALNRFQGESVERNQIALVLQDVTSVKQLEELLKSHSRQLEQTVEDQILQIVRQQRALVHSEKLASLGTLVAGAAHEINTSGSFIRTNLEVMQEYWREIEPILEKWAVETKGAVIGKQPALRVIRDVKGLLEDLDVGASHLGKIVEGMLAFSRKDVRKKEAFELDGAIETALTVTGARVSSFFSVHKRSSGRDRRVYGNRAQIVQVLVDLILNACDAREAMNLPDPGKLTLLVRSSVHSRRVTMTVADTAGGMREDVASQVFDPFYTTKPGKGTGLGLSICHGIIGEHGGEIWVKNRPGIGCAFCFSLPMLEREADSHLLPSSGASFLDDLKKTV